MKQCVLLSVEDSEADFLILQLALKALDISYKLYRATDGEAGLEFLRQRDDYRDAPRPDLVISNVDMPRKNGLELLAEMQADANLKSIPVMMFTSGRQTNLKKKALELGAREYISKPMDLGEFVDAIKTACLRLLADHDTHGAD